MADNTVLIDNLHVRKQAVSRLILPLRPKRNGHPQQVESRLMLFDGGSAIIACNPTPGSNNHRDWYFKTQVESLLGQYFEIWKQVEGDSGKYLLQDVQLQLHKVIGAHEAPEEVLALHCEPKSTDETLAARLKRGPHFHLKQAGPLGKAHLPLNLCHLSDVLQSLETLSAAMMKAIEVAVSEAVLANWG